MQLMMRKISWNNRHCQVALSTISALVIVALALLILFLVPEHVFSIRKEPFRPLRASQLYGCAERWDRMATSGKCPPRDSSKLVIDNEPSRGQLKKINACFIDHFEIFNQTHICNNDNKIHRFFASVDKISKESKFSKIHHNLCQNDLNSSLASLIGKKVKDDS